MSKNYKHNSKPVTDYYATLVGCDVEVVMKNGTIYFGNLKQYKNGVLLLTNAVKMSKDVPPVLYENRFLDRTSISDGAKLGEIIEDASKAVKMLEYYQTKQNAKFKQLKQNK
jgi:small nuclear ribonucleoprotein (snRNP)-like protein